jgi:hypothetical protein
MAGNRLLKMDNTIEFVGWWVADELRQPLNAVFQQSGKYFIISDFTHEKIEFALDTPRNIKNTLLFDEEE